MGRRFGVVTLVIAALVVAGCGGDDDETTTEAAAGDLDRYCELSQELDQAGQEFFGKLERQNASRKEFEQAERQFLEENEAKIDEVVEVAPVEIRSEVQGFAEGLRGQAGLSEADIPEEDIEAAEQRVNEFEQENCPS